MMNEDDNHNCRDDADDDALFINIKSIIKG